MDNWLQKHTKIVSSVVYICIAIMSSALFAMSIYNYIFLISIMSYSVASILIKISNMKTLYVFLKILLLNVLGITIRILIEYDEGSLDGYLSYTNIAIKVLIIPVSILAFYEISRRMVGDKK